jgi:hypothetical protein
MPEKALVLRSKVLQPAVSYPELRARVKKTFGQGRRLATEALEKITVRTFWEIGREIDRFIKYEKPETGRAPYGEGVIKKLSNDLNYDDAILYKALKLARTYPIFEHVRKLTWTHHFDLLSIPDNELRKQLTQKASDENWSTYRTRAEVRRLNAKGIVKGTPKSRQRLRAKKGKLHTYEVVQKGGKLFLDLGFRDFCPLPPQSAKVFRAGDFVAGESFENLKKKAGATRVDLYTYKAQLTGFPDADTFWVLMHLGFGRWREEKLRLRGLDTPEISADAGKKARKAVAELLQVPAEAGVEFSRPVLITTTKTPDKYDRYLTDLYCEKDGAEIYMNDWLLENGFARLV